MEPRLKNWRNYPPPGGWGVTMSMGGQTLSVQAQTPDQVVNKIAIHQKRNAAFKGMQPIWDYCNSIWCKRSPDRCGEVGSVMEKSTFIPANNTEATPAQYGAKLWGMLDTFGMKGAFHEDTWSHAITHIGRILNPDVSPDVGCSECHNEWIKIIKDSPPKDVKNSKDAALWIFEMHNRVNRRAGKPQYKWERAVIKNHWEI